MPKASKLASCFKRSISVSDSISLLLEAFLFYQGSSLIDLFFLSPTFHSSALLRFVLIYLNYPRIKYQVLNEKMEITVFEDASLRCNFVGLLKHGSWCIKQVLIWQHIKDYDFTKLYKYTKLGSCSFFHQQDTRHRCMQPVPCFSTLLTVEI